MSLLSPALVPYFKCPECGGSLHENAQSLICAYGHAYKIQDNIPIFSVDQSYYYNHVSRDFVEDLLRSTSPVVDNMRAAIKQNPNLAFLQSQALDTSRCVLTFLCDVKPDSRILDLGCGWGPLSVALAEAGCQVVAADLTLPRLAFLSRRCKDEGRNNITTVCLGDRQCLPFSEETFDLVVLNGVLEWVPECRPGPPRKLQKQYLIDVKRVLKPDGQLFLAIENRYGYGYLLGRREDHTSLRYGALLPRFLANLYSLLVRGKPYRTYTHSRGGCLRLLRQAGYRSVTFYGTIPSYRQPGKIADLKNPVGMQKVFSGPTRTNALATKLRTFVGSTPLAPNLVPSFMIVASPTRNLTCSLKELACKHIGDTVTVDWIQRSTPGLIIARVSASKGEFIFRAALNDVGCLRVRRNARALKVLQQAPPLLRDFIPRLIAHSTLLGRNITSEEMISGHSLSVSRIHKSPQTQREIDKFLGALTDGGGAAPRNPADWVRNWLDRIRPTLSASAEPALIERLYDFCLSCPDLHLLRLARVHGDFSHRNVLFDAHTGRIAGVIDWDGYSTCGPTFIDHLHWEYRRKVANPFEATSLLLDQLDSLKEQRNIPPPDDCPPASDWWTDSFWAHLVYGLWYNTNLSKWSADRLMMVAQILSHVPEK